MSRKTRKYLTPAEFKSLYKALPSLFSTTLKRNRALLLLMYRHGLRVSEALSLKWSDISKEDQTIAIRRLKNGKHSVHPIQSDELQLLNQVRNEQDKLGILAQCIFLNYKTGLPLTRRGVSQLFELLDSKGIVDIAISPHTLRHSCGYYLANKGYDTRLIQDYLGHRNIQNTEIYTELSAKKFDDIRW